MNGGINPVVGTQVPRYPGTQCTQWYPVVPSDYGDSLGTGRYPIVPSGTQVVARYPGTQVPSRYPVGTQLVPSGTQ